MGFCRDVLVGCNDRFGLGGRSIHIYRIIAAEPEDTVDVGSDGLVGFRTGRERVGPKREEDDRERVPTHARAKAAGVERDEEPEGECILITGTRRWKIKRKCGK